MVLENGKTILDAKGDITRGIEVVEHACGLSHVSQGETFGNVTKGVDIYSYRVPLGVCGGVSAFNFPAMIPLWMFPYAITLGNTFVLKPSERVPNTIIQITKLLENMGLPKGVFNLVNGQFDTVTHMCENKTIKALSFVGGNNAGDYMYQNGAVSNKRMQINMGAKNHCIVLPDADKEDTLNALIGAGFGAAGQRCMALTTVVFVGKSQEWIEDFAAKAKKLKIGYGLDADTDVAAICYPELKNRIIEILDTVEP
eukprot:CAMPEP_0204821630 /NCGR_PEP_ID=MMETSP1018-20131115/38853_1 /ASSEMBLY_ACC=CAM_ASM_000518 /TAXON_ID=46462 /ORGANISM="Anophryoides haemophila, Strain AH6" /LENGTH=254 /DNA_ID=CAMNT_0051938529 /DNA_START=358 /DNA_END=1122 /DNA_ORIENTATION=-